MVKMVSEMFEAIIIWLVIVFSKCSLPQEYVHNSQSRRYVHRMMWIYAQVEFLFFDLLVFQVAILMV
jgi:hypothetical protein